MAALMRMLFQWSPLRIRLFTFLTLTKKLWRWVVVDLGLQGLSNKRLS